MEIIILMCLWTERNRWVFDNDDPQNCKATFKRDFTLLWQGVKGDHIPTMQSWLISRKLLCRHDHLMASP
jgi:hypothetical protein